MGSHSPPRLPVPSPGRAPCHLSWLLSPRIRSTSCHPAGGHLPSSLRSHERLNVVAASRDHSAPGRTAAWEVRAPESVPGICPVTCSRPGVGSVNRKLTVTWRERLVLRAWGDLVRSSQGTRGWPRPRPTAKAEVGAQRPGEGHGACGCRSRNSESGVAGPGSGWLGESPGAQDAVQVPSRHGAGLGPSGRRVVSRSCHDKAS